MLRAGIFSTKLKLKIIKIEKTKKLVKINKINVPRKGRYFESCNLSETMKEAEINEIMRFILLNKKAMTNR